MPATAVAARTVEALVDRYPIRNRAVREVFVRYLKEREPGMDFTSLDGLARRLVKLFWCDLERYHPEVTTLDVPREVQGLEVTLQAIAEKKGQVERLRTLAPS